MNEPAPDLFAGWVTCPACLGRPRRATDDPRRFLMFYAPCVLCGDLGLVDPNATTDLPRLTTFQFVPDDPGVAPTEAQRRNHALNVADWIERDHEHRLDAAIDYDANLIVEALREFGGRRPLTFPNRPAYPPAALHDGEAVLPRRTDWVRALVYFVTTLLAIGIIYGAATGRYRFGTGPTSDQLFGCTPAQTTASGECR